MRVSLFNHIQSWPPWHQNHKCDRPQNSMEPSILDVNDFDSSTSIFINLFFGWLNILRVPSIDAKKCFHYFRRHHHVDCVSELDVAQQNPQTSAKRPEKPMVFPSKTYGVPMKNPRFSHENRPFRSGWNWEPLVPDPCGARRRAGGDGPCVVFRRQSCFLMV